MICEAIVKLQGTFDVIAVLITKESRASLGSLRQCLDPNVRLKEVEVSDSNEASEFFKAAGDIIGLFNDTQEYEVVIDITHGFRYLPLIYLAAVHFLTNFRQVHVSKILYGKWKRGMSSTPIIDCTAALSIIQWAQAAKSFGVSGDASLLAIMIQGFQKGVPYSQYSTAKLRELEKALKGLVHPLGEALSIEIGLVCKNLVSILNNALNETLSPTHSLMLKEVRHELEPLYIRQNISRKQDLVLTEDELQRQLDIVKWFMEKKRFSDTMLLLREYVINKILFYQKEQEWLLLKKRDNIENILSALVSINSDDRLKQCMTDPQKELAKNWDILRQLRNQYAHGGFRPNEIRDDHDRLESLIKYFEGLGEVSLKIESTIERLLVSPIGLSKGVLYSAIVTVRPDYVIVVTSDEGAKSIEEVLKRADYAQSTVKVILLKDPHSGFDEIGNVVKECSPTVITARHVYCNVTGGTTLMGEVARAIGKKACRLGIDTEYIAMIDRRPLDVQKTNPFVVGEMMPVEGED